MAKHAGLIAVAILVCGLLFTVLRWRGGLHMTFSQHVARSRVSAVYYSVLFAVSLPWLYLFFSDWFVPAFQLPGWFIFVAGVSIVAQFLCTLIPEVGGWKTVVHKVLAGVSAVLLMPLVAMIALSTTVSQNGKTLAGVCFIGMFLVLAAAVQNQKTQRYTLLLQAGYYVLFFIPIFYVTYF